MEKFVHLPLNDATREFRLLEISKSSSDTDHESILICTLRHAPVPNQPGGDYETVSYCWGDRTPCMPTRVNNHILLVPKNTYQTLQLVSSPDRKRTIWMDAVCINQTDAVERAEQVPLMSKIYRYSSGNIINLGPEDGTTTRAVENINAIMKEIRRESNDLKDLRTLIQPSNRWVDAAQPMLCTVDTEALIEFYSRPWFSRVWVVQEAVLSPHHQCIFGDHELEFLQIITVAAWLYHYHRYHIQQSLAMMQGLKNASWMWEFRFSRIEATITVTSALSSCIDLDASDVRDRVFGMLGITTNINQPIPELLKPDYKKHESEIFRDATRYAIQQRRHLYIMRYVFHRRDEDVTESRFPSWVPRFDRREGPGTNGNTFALGYRYLLGVWDSKINSLGNFPGDANILSLHGVVLGKVTGTTPVFSDEDTQTFWRMMFLMIQKQDSYKERFARTLAADVNHRHERMAGEDLQDFHEWLAYTTSGPGHTLGTLSALPADATDQVKRATNWWQAALNAAMHRRWAVTDMNLMALVPKISRPGDIVFAVEAADVPYVLRPISGDEYHFIGECYLENNMDGQAPERQKHDGTPNVTFNLR